MVPQTVDGASQATSRDLEARERRLVIVTAVIIVILLAAVYIYRHYGRSLTGKDRYDPDVALLTRGNPHLREIALTFDDGPKPEYGPPIAALLKSRGIAATFFVIGKRVKEYPQILKQLSDDGFEIGNHTYDHQRLPSLKPHEIANELRFCDQDIFKVTGKHTTLMRPPGDEMNTKVLWVAKALGYVTVSYTVGAKDFGQDPPTAMIIHRILARTKPGTIILLHQTSHATLEALPTMLDVLKSRGFHFVTISQMLAHESAQLPTPPAR